MNKFKKYIDKIFNYKKIIAIVLLSIIVLVGVGFYWWTTTPQYAVSQIKKAYKTHDVNLGLKYIDTDAIAEDYWNQTQKSLLGQISNSDNGWETLGLALGQNMIQNLKPTVKEKIKETIIGSIKYTSPDSNMSKVMKDSTIYRDGDIVVVEIKGSPLKLNLAKEKNQWKMIAIRGLDALVDISSKDGLIKANLNSIRPEAELIYDKNNFSYKGLCENPDIITIFNKIKENSTEYPFCKVSDNSHYKIYAKLNAFDGTKAFCIDSSGVAKEIEISGVQLSEKTCTNE